MLEIRTEEIEGGSDARFEDTEDGDGGYVSEAGDERVVAIACDEVRVVFTGFGEGFEGREASGDAVKAVLVVVDAGGAGGRGKVGVFGLAGCELCARGGKSASDLRR